jgi:hypothetical protein
LGIAVIVRTLPDCVTADTTGTDGATLIVAATACDSHPLAVLIFTWYVPDGKAAETLLDHHVDPLLKLYVKPVVQFVIVIWPVGTAHVG